MKSKKQINTQLPEDCFAREKKQGVEINNSKNSSKMDKEVSTPYSELPAETLKKVHGNKEINKRINKLVGDNLI